MAKPFVLPRKRGNPNWGQPIKPAPAIPASFDEQVKKLELNVQTCAT